MKYNHIIEDWWRHNGVRDRAQASGITYVQGHTQIYLQLTDNWWDSLSAEEKVKVYEEFFSEV